jgi:hypothetical protein
MLMMIFSSTAAIGGVRGKGDGIAHRAIVQAGATMKERHLFMEVYPPVGEMITGSVVGGGMNGINKEFPTSKFSKTGKAGKETDIGRGKIPGVSGS